MWTILIRVCSMVFSKGEMGTEGYKGGPYFSWQSKKGLIKDKYSTTRTFIIRGGSMTYDFSTLRGVQKISVKSGSHIRLYRKTGSYQTDHAPGSGRIRIYSPAWRYQRLILQSIQINVAWRDTLKSMDIVFRKWHQY